MFKYIYFSLSWILSWFLSGVVLLETLATFFSNIHSIIAVFYYIIEWLFLISAKGCIKTQATWLRRFGLISFNSWILIICCCVWRVKHFSNVRVLLLIRPIGSFPFKITSSPQDLGMVLVFIHSVSWVSFYIFMHIEYFFL